MKIMHALSPLKRIPIIDVAKRLGIPVSGPKAMCFMGHDKASPMHHRRQPSSSANLARRMMA
jgi:hypothetical protein